MSSPTIHATAVLVGARAALIRGPSGSGKSRLALALLQAASAGALPFARLVADDRVQAQAHHGRLILRPAPALEGLLEIRGVGIRKFPFEPLAVAQWVVDLAAPDAERVPSDGDLVSVEGVQLARLAVAPGVDALPLLLQAFMDEGFSPASAPYKAA
jgi:serine kinase of HPr protein (carbohydrate metabolism regulator)